MWEQRLAAVGHVALTFPQTAVGIAYTQAEFRFGSLFILIMMTFSNLVDSA